MVRKPVLLWRIDFMSTYYRPNLTEAQRNLLIALVDERISTLNYTDAKFDELYRTIIKLKDTKLITTDSKSK